MDKPFDLLVSLWAKAGCEAALGDYEEAVLALLYEHGAAVVWRARRTDLGSGPLETQVIHFPSEHALNSFMTDPRRLALAGTRDAVVAHTETTRIEML